MPRGRKPKENKIENEVIENKIVDVSDESDIVALKIDIDNLKDQLAQATAEGRGMVGVYEAIDAINNRLVDLDKLEEKVNSFIKKIETIHENRGCQL